MLAPVLPDAMTDQAIAAYGSDVRELEKTLIIATLIPRT